MRFRIFLITGLMALRAGVLGDAPKVSLPPSGPPNIEAQGQPGELLSIEASSNLSAGWDMLGSLVLTNDTVRWPDLWAGNSSSRFYRVTRSVDDVPFAENFRLIDHLGKSRELFYYARAPEIKAFVLIFTQTGCGEIVAQLPTINGLRTEFEKQGVLFWMVDSHPADTRASIAAEAARLNMTLPILHDRAGTVARLYRAGTAAEAVCINRENLTVFYRGALEYVRDALNAQSNGTPYNLRQMKARGCDLPSGDAAEVSYSREVAPILQAKCITCHSLGNVAPWAMTNYAIVKDYSLSMLEQISSKEMPPWHADPEYGRFKNDLSLSVDEEKKLIRWLLAGAPRGDGPDPLETLPPPVPKWPAELGEPDLVIRAPVQHVAANGVEPYRYIFVDTGLTNDVWLRAAIVRPSNPKVVHHYLVWEGASMQQMAVGLAGYVPGTQRGALPEGTGLMLHGNTPLTFNLHYTPDGDEAQDEPELALWFHKTPPAKALILYPVLNLNFNIPAGAREYEVTARPLFVQALPYAGTLYSLSPHMHYRGARMRFDVTYPDGTTETLLSVPHYDFHWQTTYQLAEPKKIPAGSKIVLRGAFDNSDLNLHNPDPTKSVQWGEQSWEEMFIGYFDFTRD
jgi:hypothetical protein